MTWFYIILGASVLLFGASAVYALTWAFRNGQLENFQRGATSIFDPGEPIGEVTDGFPGEAEASRRAAGKGTTSGEERS